MRRVSWDRVSVILGQGVLRWGVHGRGCPETGCTGQGVLRQGVLTGCPETGCTGQGGLRQGVMRQGLLDKMS